MTYLTVRKAGREPQTRVYYSIDTVRANLEAFAQAAESGTPYPFTRAQKLHNIAVLEAVIESVDSGQAVTVA